MAVVLGLGAGRRGKKEGPVKSHSSGKTEKGLYMYEEKKKRGNGKGRRLTFERQAKKRIFLHSQARRKEKPSSTGLTGPKKKKRDIRCKEKKEVVCHREKVEVVRLTR